MYFIARLVLLLFLGVAIVEVLEDIFSTSKSLQVAITNQQSQGLVRRPQLSLALQATSDSSHPQSCTMSSTFQYKPLVNPTTDIRLVTIEPASSDDDDIKCTLKAVTIHNARYESLSYAWGNTSIKSTINLDGKPFEVTINLEQALRSLRRPADSRTLWIDAICIDQGNLLERSQQVQRMSSIYKTAEQVIIWLGNYHESEDENCWELPYQFDARVWGFDHVEPATFEDIQNAFELAENLNAEYDSKADMFKPNGLVEQTVDARCWAYLSLLCRRSYFKRLWVVQEIFHARKATTMCGRAGTCWESLKGAADALMACAKVPENCPIRTIPLGSDMLSINVTSVSLQRAHGRHVLSMIQQTKGLRATDDRDRLYALKSLLGEDAVDIDIDYSKTTEQVYQDWARKRINRTKRLDVLSACVDSHRTPYIGENQLPSWVPDLRNTDEVDWWLFGTSNGLQNVNFQYASTGFGPCIEVIKDDADEATLSLAGFCVEKVVKKISIQYGKGMEYRNNRSSNLRNCVLGLESQISEYLGIPMEYGSRLYVAFVDVLFRGCRWFNNVYGGTWSEDTPQYRYNIWRNNAPLPESYKRDLPQEERRKAFVDNFEIRLSIQLPNGEIFITDRGLLGIVSRNCKIEVGDEVWVLLGGNTPFILQPLEEGNYHLQGPCYLDTYMDSQVIYEWRRGDLEIKTVDIV